MDKNTESIIDVVTVDEKKNKTKKNYNKGCYNFFRICKRIM